MDRKSMRILVLGDQNVGKTTLIHMIYSEVSEKKDKTLKKVTLPPQMCKYSKEVITELIDTSFDMDEQTFKSEIQSSDLILLVYDITEDKSIQRLESYWLSKIYKISTQKPLVLVGNKNDKKQTEQFESWQLESPKQILKRVRKNYKNVQMGLQCSAYFNRNVSSVLNCAHRAVLYPLAPLYNLQQRKITEQFRKAIIRIFRIFDSDMDGKLRDSELNQLHERVFQSQLCKQDVIFIKQKMLREETQQNYIELQGFISLLKQCIQMLKIQICWSVLRYFKYDDNLRIKLDNNSILLDEKAKQSVQLSSQTINFLIQIYNMQKKKYISQSTLSQNEINQKILKSVFEPCPQIQLPQFNKISQMNEQKFLTTCNLYSFINYKKFYQILMYLGYQKKLQQTFIKKKNKKKYKDFIKIKDNKVFSILIIDSQSNQTYLQLLFLQSQSIIVKNTMTSKSFQYHRTSFLYTNQNISKTFLLFKVQQKDLQNFFTNKQTDFSQKIDILVQFQEDKTEMFDKNKYIPDTILYKKISQQQALNVLHVNQSPQLKLTELPVKLQKIDNTAFFQQIIKIIYNIELGLLQRKREQFKQQQMHEKRKNIIWGVVVGVLTGIGIFVITNKYQIKNNNQSE